MNPKLEFGTQSDGSVDLESCLVQVEASKAWFTRRILPLSIEQLLWRPEPWRWSIAECLDHLNATYRVWLPRVNAATSASSRLGHTLEGSPRYEGAEIEALRLVEPPVVFRAVAPPDLIPAAAVDPDELVDYFCEFRDQYAETLRRAFGLDLARILLTEPIAPLIQSLGGALAFLAAHERRHTWQSEQVRTAPRFPKAAFAAEVQGEARLAAGEKSTRASKRGGDIGPAANKTQREGDRGIICGS